MARGKEIVIHRGAVVEPHRSRIASVLSAPARGFKAFNQMVFARSGWHGSGLMWRFFPRTRFNYAAEVGDGMGSSLIMAVALWICRTFPEAPLVVRDKDGEEIVGHPMIAKLRRPNGYYSGLVLWMAILMSWVLDGNAYIVKIRNKTGTGGPVELWYVPHWLIEPRGDETTFISDYIYTVGGRRETLEVEDVIHLRYGLDPRNPRKGLSPLGTVLREVFTDDEAANFSASLLRNLGIPGLIVSPEGTQQPSPDDVAAVKDYVNDQFGGDKRGQPMVMSGPTKVEQFGFSPEQMNLRALRRIPEERITAVLGIPAVVVGFGAGLDRSTYNNMGEAREQAYESNIIPTQRLMAEELWMQLLPDYESAPDNFTVAFDTTAVRVLQEDRNKAGERTANLYSKGVITRAEARIEVGQETTTADDVYVVPIAVSLVPAAQEPGEDPLLAPPKRLKLAGSQTAAQERLMEAFKRDRAAFGAALTQELELDFDGLGRRAAELYTETKQRTNGNGRKASNDEEVWAHIESGLGLDEFSGTQLRHRFEVHYGRVVEHTTGTINNVLDLGISLPDHVARAIVADGGTRAGLVDVTKQTRDSIFQALAEGREAGDGPIEIARRIRSAVPAGRFVNAGPKYRAELIARTETMHAQRTSALAAYREATTVTSVTIFDGNLEGSDEECEARNGEVVSFDEAEQLSDDEHPNGTLAFAPNV